MSDHTLLVPFHPDKGVFSSCSFPHTLLLRPVPALSKDQTTDCSLDICLKAILSIFSKDFTSKNDTTRILQPLAHNGAYCLLWVLYSELLIFTVGILSWVKLL